MSQTKLSEDVPNPHGGVHAIGTNTAAAVAADGNVTSLQDAGGPILTHAHLSLIFWGKAWTLPMTTPTKGQFSDALLDIVGGAWGTQLNQYHGIGRAVIDEDSIYASSDPPTVFQEADVQNFVDSRINNGDVTAPAISTQRIYVVLLPKGCSFTPWNFAGRHQNYSRPDGTQVYYAWITNDGTLTGVDSIPKVFSHELAEAVTDPNVSTGPFGITLNNDPNDEIGDVCNGTFHIVNGHAEEAYWSQTDKRCVMPTRVPFPKINANMALIQSRFGSKGNFELVGIDAGAGLFQCARNNDNSFAPWSGPVSFGNSIGVASGISMIQSNFGSPGNLEVVCIADGQLQFFWRDSGPTFAWHGPTPIESNFRVIGNPALIQSRFGQKGNFELVVPAAAGGLLHFARVNDDPALPWGPATSFGQNLGVVSGVTMIQSNFGSPGNLEVVCIANGQLQFFGRDSGPPFVWHGPIPISNFQVVGNPALIQSRFGQKGNFELVVPAAAGGLLHFARVNDDPVLPWGPATSFGQDLGVISGVGLIQSNFGDPGNLEVVCNAGGQLYHFWRDSGPSFAWNGPFKLMATIW